MRTMIGESLRQAGIITEQDLQTALVEQKRSGERLGSVLVRMHLAGEREIARALAGQLGLRYVDLAEHPPDPTAVLLIPKGVAFRGGCIAIAVAKNELTVAMSDPLLLTLVQDLEFQTGHRVKQVVSTAADIARAIEAWYSDTALTEGTGRRPGERNVDPCRGPAVAANLDQPTRLGEHDSVGSAPRRVDVGETAPIADIVDTVIKGALKGRASDIHIEPTENEVVVRHRLDGLLKLVSELPKWVHDGLVARIKIMAGLDIAEKRLPQDGRIRVSADEGHDIDLRVSTLKTIFGEKVVLRLLDLRKGVPPVEELGLSAAALDRIRFFLRHQHGMILVVGPTGSGKTTTLSSALASIRSVRTNIVTIEDPVEYQIPGVNQTQINARINLTFASALRAILRQDPDVVLVGEIRDQETARIAMQAAQTGHLVLSTLHTDDAPSCVTRLSDIGIEPYVTASALIGVVAQRLVRRLCMECRSPYTPDAEMLRAMGLPEGKDSPPTFYRAVGCRKCNRIGYRGRVGIYEVLTVNDDLRRLIAQRGAGTELREAAIVAGMVSLGEDGLSKVKAGLTTPQELLRVVTEVRQSRRCCEACGTQVSAAFAACPHCGRQTDGACPHCRRRLEPDWNWCPYCTKPVAPVDSALETGAPGARRTLALARSKDR